MDLLGMQATLGLQTKDLEFLTELMNNCDTCLAEIDIKFKTVLGKLDTQRRVLLDALDENVSVDCKTSDLLFLHSLTSTKPTYRHPQLVDRLDFLMLAQHLHDWTRIAATPSILFEFGGSDPTGIAITKSGKHLIVASECSHQVIVLTLTGQIISIIGGTHGNRQGQFNYHLAVAVEPQTGNIWVADYGNDRLQIFTEQGQFVHSISVPSGPLSVAFLSNGNVVVTMKSDELIIFTPDGQQVRRVGRYGNGNGEFNNPYDVKVSSTDEIFVANRYNHCVQVLSADGKWLRSFGGSQSKMDSPSGLALTPDGFVVVVEWGGHCVSVWSPTGQRVHRWGSKGSTPGQFKYPWHVALLPDGRVAVADNGNDRIQLF
jgi:DNA-binding beta-propeller fold protein YncE